MIQKHTTWPSSSTRFKSGHVENRLRICWWHYKHPHTLIQWFPNRGAAALLGAVYNTQGCGELKTFFKYIIKHTFWKCHQTSNQIAVGSPLGAV